MRAPQERLLSALCHLFNAIPLWGLLFSGLIWMRLREESRAVVWQAQQAMMFHAILMAGVLVCLLVHGLSRLVSILAPDVGAWLATANRWIVAALLIAYVVTCMVGFFMSLTGRTFRYPVVRFRG